jgi:hypothetical protein
MANGLWPVANSKELSGKSRESKIEDGGSRSSNSLLPADRIGRQSLVTDPPLGKRQAQSAGSKAGVLRVGCLVFGLPSPVRQAGPRVRNSKSTIRNSSALPYALSALPFPQS